MANENQLRAPKGPHGSASEARSWALKHGCMFADVNVRSGEGIESLFSMLLSRLLPRSLSALAGS